MEYWTVAKLQVTLHAKMAMSEADVWFTQDDWVGGWGVPGTPFYFLNVMQIYFE